MYTTSIRCKKSIESKNIMVQCAFKKEYVLLGNEKPPEGKTVRKWVEKFQNTGWATHINDPWSAFHYASISLLSLSTHFRYIFAILVALSLSSLQS